MEAVERFKRENSEGFFTFENEIFRKDVYKKWVVRLFCMYKPKCRRRGGESGENEEGSGAVAPYC